MINYCNLFLLILGLLWLPLTLLKLVIGQQQYQELMNKTELTHGLGSIGYETDKFSQLILNIGMSRYQQLLRIWFNIGAIISLLLSVFCSVFLVGNVALFIVKQGTILLSYFNNQSESIQRQPLDQTSLVMLVPGVNVPTTDLPFMIVALFLCAVIHEFGHAVAAAVDKIQTDSVGFNLFLIFPSAYVVLPSSDLQRASFFGKLRIYCAGAWHNVVLCLFAVVIIIFCCSPGWPSSLIESNGAYIHRGVFIESVSEESPLRQLLMEERSLPYITGVGDCPVVDHSTWTSCLTQIMNTNYGYCVPYRKVIDGYEHHGDQCCSEMHNRQLCFSMSNPVFSNEKRIDKACLIAREVTNHPPCPKECASRDHICITPDQENESKDVHHSREHLLRIRLLETEESGEDKDVIYYGTIPSLYQQIQVSNYRVKHPFNGTLSLNSIAIVEKICRYTFALSSALALLNLAPVYMLDGSKIYETLLVYLSVHYQNRISPVKFKNFYHRMCKFFTVLLVLNMLIAAYNMAIMVFSPQATNNK
jgi:S2P endopeptidase